MWRLLSPFQKQAYSNVNSPWHSLHSQKQGKTPNTIVSSSYSPLMNHTRFLPLLHNSTPKNRRIQENNKWIRWNHAFSFAFPFFDWFLYDIFVFRAVPARIVFTLRWIFARYVFYAFILVRTTNGTRKRLFSFYDCIVLPFTGVLAAFAQRMLLVNMWSLHITPITLQHVIFSFSNKF